jgi:hypothetical protein
VDLGMLRTLGRGLKPIVLLDRRTPDRLPFAVDTHHPVGGAHHQKIVVIDDCRAFAGGIHVTADRWDPSDHADGNPHRRPPVAGRPEGRPTGPWHDATSIMIGVLFVGQRLQLLDRGAHRRLLETSLAAPAPHRPVLGRMGLPPWCPRGDTLHTHPAVSGWEHGRPVERGRVRIGRTPPQMPRPANWRCPRSGRWSAHGARASSASCSRWHFLAGRPDDVDQGVVTSRRPTTHDAGPTLSSCAADRSPVVSATGTRT